MLHLRKEKQDTRPVSHPEPVPPGSACRCPGPAMPTSVLQRPTGVLTTCLRTVGAVGVRAEFLSSRPPARAQAHL